MNGSYSPHKIQSFVEQGYFKQKGFYSQSRRQHGYDHTRNIFGDYEIEVDLNKGQIKLNELYVQSYSGTDVKQNTNTVRFKKFKQELSVEINDLVNLGITCY